MLVIHVYFASVGLQRQSHEVGGWEEEEEAEVPLDFRI